MGSFDEAFPARPYDVSVSRRSCSFVPSRLIAPKWSLIFPSFCRRRQLFRRSTRRRRSAFLRTRSPSAPCSETAPHRYGLLSGVEVELYGHRPRHARGP